MENISLLLSDALSPYQVSVGAADVRGDCRVVLSRSAGDVVLQRTVNQHQFEDLRSFTDVVDGLHRDLLVAEGRLQPCMIAAMLNASLPADGYSSPRV